MYNYTVYIKRTNGATHILHNMKYHNEWALHDAVLQLFPDACFIKPKVTKKVVH